jgi:hypothetical protein
MDENDELFMDTSLISNCCGAAPLGDTYDADPKYNIPITGICSSCHEHCSFNQEGEEE